MGSLICLTRRGASLPASASEIEQARARFAAGHALHLPGFLDPELLATVQTHIESDGFDEHVHEQLPSRPVDLRVKQGRGWALLLLLTNDAPVLDFARTVTGEKSIRSFAGAVARRIPGAGHEDAWHSDAGGGRLAALTVNLSGGAYEGGVLQIQEAVGGRIVFELANTGPGDAVLFKIDPALKHRVTPPEGRASRTAFAGWFLADSSRRLLGLPRVGGTGTI
jgi:hypothetical protein